MPVEMLKTGSDWLLDRQKEFNSKSVTYSRGSASVVLQATIGRTVWEIDNGVGILEKYESRDFIIQTVDLVLSSAVVLPVRGDRIGEVRGAKTYTYEVMSPALSIPHYRGADDFKKAHRIHTKLVGS